MQENCPLPLLTFHVLDRLPYIASPLIDMSCTMIQILAGSKDDKHAVAFHIN